MRSSIDWVKNFKDMFIISLWNGISTYSGNIVTWIWMTWSPYDWMTLAVALCAQSWLTMMGNFSGSGRYFNNPSKQRLTEGRLQENTIMGNFIFDLSLLSVSDRVSAFAETISELICSTRFWISRADFCEIPIRKKEIIIAHSIMIVLQIYLFGFSSILQTFLANLYKLSLVEKSCFLIVWYKWRGLHS